MSFVVAGIGVAVGGAQFFSARKDKKRAQREAAAAQAELNKQKAAFQNVDVSNPFANIQNQYAGLENTMEDLTVNQQQAQMENQQGAQQRANIMANMRGMAGGSGIAALAQQMAQSGQLQAQQTSANIGQQEAANQKAMAAEAGRLQTQEAQGAMDVQRMKAEGDQWSAQQQMNKASTLMGMSQADLAGARQNEAAAKAAQWDAVGNIAGAAAGFSDRRLKRNIELIGKSPSGISIYTFEYIDERLGKGRFQGTMSDEVSADVIIKHDSGFDMIDYSKIDVEFKSIK